MKVKSTKISLKYSNIGKILILSSIIKEYKKAVDFYVDYLWNNKINFNNKTLDIKNHLYDCPQFISNNQYKSSLSGRLLKAASTQACTVVSTALEKHKRCLYILNKKKENKERTRKLTKLLSKKILIKPKCDNINLELNSNNVEIK